MPPKERRRPCKARDCKKTVDSCPREKKEGTARILQGVAGGNDEEATTGGESRARVKKEGQECFWKSAGTREKKKGPPRLQPVGEDKAEKKKEKKKNRKEIVDAIF